VGCQHGYFLPQEEHQVVTQVAAARPDILLVALGVPKQEKWIARHLQELNVPVAIGVGGSFDVLAGKVKRAPGWARACGLEWLWRSLREPRRLPRLLALPRFFLLGLRWLLSRRTG
jgi:N-acetylglucosaminyldiphosphoundecaprenol N-acetyl-beta-D-mannosaminyltransferase